MIIVMVGALIMLMVIVIVVLMMAIVMVIMVTVKMMVMVWVAMMVMIVMEIRVMAKTMVVEMVWVAMVVMMMVIMKAAMMMVIMVMVKTIPDEDAWAHRLHRETGVSWGSLQTQDSQIKAAILPSPFLTQPPCLPETSMANRTKLRPWVGRMTASSMTCGGRATFPWSLTTRIQRRNR